MKWTACCCRREATFCRKMLFFRNGPFLQATVQRRPRRLEPKLFSRMAGEGYGCNDAPSRLGRTTCSVTSHRRSPADLPRPRAPLNLFEGTHRELDHFRRSDPC